MEFIELILINKLDGVILKYPHHENVDGTVCITGHHLILSSRKEGVRELWVSLIGSINNHRMHMLFLPPPVCLIMKLVMFSTLLKSADLS